VDRRTRAREALSALDWATAFDAFTSLADDPKASAEDLEGLAHAAWWLGRMEVSADAHERAHQMYADSGQTDGSVMTAIYLSYHHFNRGDFAIGSAWHARAARLAEKIPDSPAAGYLGVVNCGSAYRAGDLPSCLAIARRVLQIGETHQDATLVAWGIHWQGVALVRQGRVDEGWRMLDEAILDVSRKHLQPLWAGFLHCNTIQVCDELADPRRGWQWVEVTERWIQNASGGPLYPGICRMFKATILRERGIWPQAEVEARRVCDELTGLHVRTASRAYYELGELKRLTGDDAAAEELFTQAQRMGFDPQPGLSRLRLGRGDLAGAQADLRRAFDESQDALARARLAPDLVEVAVVTGDLASARAWSEELDATAATYRSPGLTASAMAARADVLLGGGEPAAALALYREAMSLWTELGCPYRAARCQSRVAEAHRAQGDEIRARIELEAARDAFERLGAIPDAHRSAQLLRPQAHPAGLSTREIEVLRLVAGGRSNKEIAAELVISEHTAARHMSNIFAKLSVSSRAAAAAYALKHGIA
jgi:ATP/maltotriose-dependent transcriptional regulator MalT